MAGTAGTVGAEAVIQATARGAGFDFDLMRPPEVPAWGDLPAADGDAGDAP